MTATIHLIRHGQAAFGAADYDQLSDCGHQQSGLLGASLAPLWREADVAICGGMRRHRQTADACLAAMRPLPAMAAGAAHSDLSDDGDANRSHADERAPNADLHTDPRWNEFDHQQIIARHRPDYADHQHLVAELRRASDPRRAFQSLFAAAMARWSSGEFDSEYSEPWPQFVARCQAALQAAADATAAGSNVWVFTSGGPIAVIAQHLLQAPQAQALKLSWTLVNSGITQLHVARSGVRLSSFNGYAHLFGHPDLITYR